MTTITCQYTGINFEAASTRTKNHSKVTKFLDEASKDRFHVGAYGKAKELLAAAKGQTDNIDELMVAVQDAFAAWCNGEAQPKLRIAPKYIATRGYDADSNINDRDDHAKLSN